MYLINCTWDETWNFLLAVEDLWKHTTEAGSCLDSWEGDLANV